MPQKPTAVMAPIGGLDRMQMWLEEALKYRNCREAMQKLLAQLGSDTNFAPSHNDILDLFNALRGQTGGGGVFVDVPWGSSATVFPPGAKVGQDGAGGGGVSAIFYTDSSNWRTRQRVSIVYLRGAQWRSVIRYALEINDPLLNDLVRRADAGEPIIDTTDFTQTLETSDDDSSEEKIEALAEIICGASDESAAALFVLTGILENSTHPKLLANMAKHFAFTRCSESDLLGMVDAQLAVVEAELLAGDA